VNPLTEPLKRELHEIFARDYEIPRMHLFLAGVPAPLLIVTTDYDDLVERAFRKASGRSCGRRGRTDGSPY